MTKIKICGLRRREDIEIVNRTLPDFIGFVFAPSPRQVSAEEAKQLKALLNPAIRSVGVFVNQSPYFIEQLSRENVIDLIQLHGDEEEERINQIKQITKKPVIKAVRVKSEKDAAKKWNSDFVLYDAYVKSAYGGTGKTFCWALLKQAQRPFFLAGGITLETVEKALWEVRPDCIDVSGGVETGGWKDAKKIERMIEKVRGMV